MEFIQKVLENKKLLPIEKDLLFDKEILNYFIDNDGLLLLKTDDIKLIYDYLTNIFAYCEENYIEKVLETNILDYLFSLLKKEENIQVNIKHNNFDIVYNISYFLSIKLKNKMVGNLLINDNYSFLIDCFVRNNLDINSQFYKGFANAENIYEKLFGIALCDTNCQTLLFNSGFPNKCLEKIQSLLKKDNIKFGTFRSQLSLLLNLIEMKVFYEMEYPQKYELSKVLFDMYKIMDDEDIHGKFDIILILKNLMENLPENSINLINFIEYILECNELSRLGDHDDLCNYPKMLSILIKSILNNEFKEIIIDQIKKNSLIKQNLTDLANIFENNKDNIDRIFFLNLEQEYLDDSYKKLLNEFE